MTYLKNNVNNKLDILTYPNPILTRPSVDIDIMGPQRMEYVKFITKMEELYRDGGEWGYMAGLAAPQVGKNWNVFIALNTTFINPKMEIDVLKGYSDLQEGCYSLERNKFDYPVRRAYKLKLSWQDINGGQYSRKFIGRDAQVIQHEMDHLYGKLCVHGGITKSQ